MLAVRAYPDGFRLVGVRHAEETAVRPRLATPGHSPATPDVMRGRIAHLACVPGSVILRSTCFGGASNAIINVAVRIHSREGFLNSKAFSSFRTRTYPRREIRLCHARKRSLNGFHLCIELGAPYGATRDGASLDKATRCTGLSSTWCAMTQSAGMSPSVGPSACWCYPSGSGGLRGPPEQRCRGVTAISCAGGLD